jgi:raffinose/stachyose/melibiose transport system substrate-binding protein
LESNLGQEIAPYLPNFLVGYEQYWVAPTGAGEWANPWASYFEPFNEWDDAKELADRAQSDLQSGLDNVSGN